MSNWLAYHSSKSPSWSSNTALYPQSVANQGTCPNSLSFYCFHPLGLIVESIKGVGGASIGLVDNLLMFIFDSLNILATIVLIMKIEIPCTIDFIIFWLKWVMAYKNSFANGWIRFNYTPNKPKMLTCWAHSTSLSTIHCWNFSISKKMIYLLSKIVTSNFSLFLSSCSSSDAIWLPPNYDSKLSLLFIFFAISLLMLPFIFTNMKSIWISTT